MESRTAPRPALRTVLDGKEIFEQLRIGPERNLAYLIGDVGSGLAALVDPAYEIDRLLGRVAHHGLRLGYIITTHSHPDHAGGNIEVRRRTGATVLAASPAARALRDFRPVEHGECVALGGSELRFLHTPGHRFDSVCVLVNGRRLMTGDTLFIGECGRTDLAGSDIDAMWRSLFEVILPLPDHVEIYPGHDYGRAPWATLGEERKGNYTLAPRSLEEFRRFMAEPETHVVFG